MNETIINLDTGLNISFGRDSIILKELKYYLGNLELYINYKDNLDNYNDCKLNFKTIQAYKIITIDSGKFKGKNFNICEIQDSEWIKELLNSSISNNFYNNSRHFHCLFYDEIIDIVAWNFEIIKI